MKIEVKYIESSWVAIFKRYGNVVKLRTFLSKSLVEDLRAWWKK